MDGLLSAPEHVFVLACTNLPWDLDLAVIRRLEKRIFVNLPDDDAKSCMLKNLLNKYTTSAMELDHIVETVLPMLRYRTGDDIRILCQEVAMSKFRKIIALATDRFMHKPLQIRIELSDMLEAVKISGSSHSETHAQRYDEFNLKFGYFNKMT